MAYTGWEVCVDLSTIFSRYNFFQQVRLMLRGIQRKPGASRLKVLTEAFHFTSPLSLDAPDGEVGPITRTPDSRWQIEVLTHGMTGALGALPTVYTEWMMERYYRYGDQSAKAFIDIFNNRLHTLRYLAWLKYHYAAQYEVTEQRPLSEALRGLAGVMQCVSSFQNESFTGLFMHPVRSALNLEVWLRNLFSITVKVITFTGGWQNMAQSQCCCLGPFGQTLGQAPMLGLVYKDMAASFTLELGPLPLSRAPQFLPGGQHYIGLWQRIREYVGPGFDFAIDLLTENDSGDGATLGVGRIGLDLCIGQVAQDVHRIRLPVYREQG